MGALLAPPASEPVPHQGAGKHSARPRKPPPVSVGPSGRGLGPTPPLQPAFLWKARPCRHSGRRCFQSRSSPCPILGQQMKFQPGPPNWPSAFWMGAGPGREELKEKERWGPASHGACALGLAASPTLCPQGPLCSVGSCQFYVPCSRSIFQDWGSRCWACAQAHWTLCKGNWTGCIWAPDLAASLLSPVDHGGLWVPADSHEFTAVIQQPLGGCDGPPYVLI